ncbi:hypothetical protein JG687_00016885, partial [Phytophthora cactorum]
GNLLSHLRDKHPDYEADYHTHASSLAGNLHSFGFVSEKVANIYHWMEWVVDRNMPLSEVDRPSTRSMSRLKTISSKTLKKYLAATTRAVEKEIAKTIPPTFSAMYDSWTCFSAHYVALYIVFWKDGQLFYVLLAVAPRQTWLPSVDWWHNCHQSKFSATLPIGQKSSEYSGCRYSARLQ